MSNEQIKLRELANGVSISGVLKEVNLEIKPNKKDPRVKQIMGNIVVMVNDQVRGVIHEHEINLFAKEGGKLYKGYVTIMNEYKPADQYGAANADLVTVTGSLDENVYVSNGTLKEFNRIRGLFVNRVDALEKHEAVAQLEVYIQSISDREVLQDGVGVPNGELNITALTVGYNNSVSKIGKIVVPANLADVIRENYIVGSTGKLNFEIVNYVEQTKVEQDPMAASEGFGMQVEVSTAKTYHRQFTVIGGFPPYYDERAISEDDARLMNQIRNVKIEEIKNSVPDTPPSTGVGGFGNANPGFGATPGFGAGGDPFAANKGPIEVSEDDLPF